MKGKNFLIASTGIYPYFDKEDYAGLAYRIARAINSAGGQTRMFMPRFGTVNERKHQLHEVIRLSGVNIVVNDDDMPLIIKVASIPKERMQVYFIENEEFFKRKFVFKDKNDEFFTDNDGRIVFFAKGVVETTKKLKWRPDYLIGFNWFSSLLPLYIKTYYKNEPLFQYTKIYVVLTDEILDKPLRSKLSESLIFDEIPDEYIKQLEKPTMENLLKLSIDLADGIILRSKNIPKSISSYVKKKKGLHIVDLSGIDLDENEKELRAKFSEAFAEKSEPAK